MLRQQGTRKAIFFDASLKKSRCASSRRFADEYASLFVVLQRRPFASLTVVPFSRSVVASLLLLLSKDTSAVVSENEITLQAAHQRFRFLRRARPRSYLLLSGISLGNHHSQASHRGVSCGISRLLRRRLVSTRPVTTFPEFYLTLRPAFLRSVAWSLLSLRPLRGDPVWGSAPPAPTPPPGPEA